MLAFKRHKHVGLFDPLSVSVALILICVGTWVATSYGIQRAYAPSFENQVRL